MALPANACVGDAFRGHEFVDAPKPSGHEPAHR
jgi:hypothetical protein